MLTVRLYIVQRIAALVMIPLVAVHLGLMIYAIAGGLTVGEILSRTHGSFAWFALYGLFVLAASAHGAIGLRAILVEWGGLRSRLAADAVTVVVAFGLFLLGARAVWAVTFAEVAA